MRFFSSVFSPLRLIGVAALAYVFYVVDVAAVFAQMRTIGAVSIGTSAAAFGVLVGIRCWRWHLLVQAAGKTIPARDSAASCNASIWLGMATPARLGEFRRGLDLARRTGGDLAQATALVVYELLLDLGAYVVVAAGGLALHYAGSRTPGGIAIYAAAIALGFLCVAWLRVPIAVSARLLPWLDKVPGLTSLRSALLANWLPRRAWLVAVATGAAFLAYAAMMFALIAPMRPDLGFSDVATTVGIAGVAGAIPITYFGIGTREVALIWHLGQLGLGKETAVAVSLSFLVAQLIGIVVSLALTIVLRPTSPKPDDVASSSPRGRVS